jgi:hypothetical protein
LFSETVSLQKKEEAGLALLSTGNEKRNTRLETKMMKK